MALANAGPHAEVRRVAALTVLALFLTATAFANAAGVRTGYPFLDASPQRPPDIVYAPTYLPSDVAGSSMRIVFGMGTELEWDLGRLRVWESTRYDANVATAIGDSIDVGTVAGTLAVWHRAESSDGGTRVLHARIGFTLIVISGTASWDELLRVADSLRRTNPQAMML